ncbi:AI-2E family transporter [Pontivivens ytuae]|uniref:AI-2E family transporter n=1 Tax=Pontivivens ytuae TaxID=2789856 RepID=A0A7S9LUJ6_9RHOB|nr:AI-2E family transporter [Pontivivens ytuae]QPH55524.1 AI-2E family transporter [Pontivivens ytuae]
MRDDQEHQGAFPQLPPIDATSSRAVDLGAKIAMMLMALIVLFIALEAAFVILAPMSLGIVLSLVLGPLAANLERRGLKPFIVAALLTLLTAVSLALIVAGIILPIRDWIARSPDIWYRLRELGALLEAQMAGIERAAEQVGEAIGGGAGGGEVGLRQQADPLTSVLPALKLAPMLIGQFLIFHVTIYFFIATRAEIRDYVLSFCLSRRARWRVARIFRDIERGISHYFATIAVINCGLGLVTAAICWAFGMPNPLVWGGLAAVLNFVPYLGPALMTAILFSVGLITFDPVLTAFLMAMSYVAANLFEGQFLTPSLVGRRLVLNPLLVFCALSFWLWLWGAAGAFLATPILLAGKVVLRHLTPQHVERF